MKNKIKIYGKLQIIRLWK